MDGIGNNKSVVYDKIFGIKQENKKPRIRVLMVTSAMFDTATLKRNSETYRNWWNQEKDCDETRTANVIEENRIVQANYFVFL